MISLEDAVAGTSRASQRPGSAYTPSVQWHQWLPPDTARKGAIGRRPSPKTSPLPDFGAGPTTLPPTHAIREIFGHQGRFLFVGRFISSRVIHCSELGNTRPGLDIPILSLVPLCDPAFGQLVGNFSFLSTPSKLPSPPPFPTINISLRGLPFAWNRGRSAIARALPGARNR